MWDCYLSIGANLGARAQTLREAIRRLAALPGTQLVRSSAFYETAPWGKTDQPPFLNGAVHLRTELAPEKLLAACQAIERALGRVRHEHWGARTADIDLVYGTCGDAVVRSRTERLTLPHPYLLERAFVLVPLAEIAPELEIGGKPVRLCCEAVRGQEVQRSSALAAPWPLRLIACVDEGRGIGRDGQLLYSIPEDMAHFRMLTQAPGSVVIMGRRTAESLPHGPLPDRLNLVLSQTQKPGGLYRAWPEKDDVLCRREGAQGQPHASTPETAEGQGGSPVHMMGAAEGQSFFLLDGLPALRKALAALYDAQPARPVWVIGGEAVYRELLPYTGEAFLTEVQGRKAADAFLPALDGFERVEMHPAQTPGVTFTRYRRF